MIHLVSIARRVCLRFFLVFNTLDLGLCVARFVTCSLDPFVMMHVVHVVSIALHAFFNSFAFEDFGGIAGVCIFDNVVHKLFVYSLVRASDWSGSMLRSVAIM